MHIKTRLKRKKLMISTPFIDNWIVTGSVARLSIIIYLILWIKDTIRLLSSHTQLVVVINIFLSNSSVIMS